MSTLVKAVLHAAVLWFHVGVGPLIGSGPLDSRREAQGRRKFSALPAGDETPVPSTGHDRAGPAQPRGQPRHPTAGPLSRSEIGERADAA